LSFPFDGGANDLPMGGFPARGRMPCKTAPRQPFHSLPPYEALRGFPLPYPSFPLCGLSRAAHRALRRR